MLHTSILSPDGTGASELVNVIADGNSISRRPGLVPAPGLSFSCFDMAAVLGRLLYQVRDDGTILVCSKKPSVLTTPGGLFRSVKVLGGDLCVEVERDGILQPERFSPQAYADTPAGSYPLPFSHIIAASPPCDESSCQHARLVTALFRLLDTGAFRVDSGRGLTKVPFRRFGCGGSDSSPPMFSGDVRIRAIGWKRPAAEPLWRIEQDDQRPFVLLKAITEWKEVLG